MRYAVAIQHPVFCFFIEGLRRIAPVEDIIGALDAVRHFEGSLHIESVTERVQDGLNPVLFRLRFTGTTGGKPGVDGWNG